MVEDQDPLHQFVLTDVYTKFKEFSHKKSILWSEFAISFVLGGLIVSGIPILLKRVDSVITAIVYGFPLTFIPIILILYFSKDRLENETNKIDFIQEFAVMSAFSLLLSLSFVGIIAVVLNYRTSKNSRKFGFGSAMGIALACWFVLALVLYIWVRSKKNGELNAKVIFDDPKPDVERYVSMVNI